MRTHSISDPDTPHFHVMFLLPLNPRGYSFWELEVPKSAAHRFLSYLVVSDKPMPSTEGNSSIA